MTIIKTILLTIIVVLILFFVLFFISTKLLDIIIGWIDRWHR